MKYQAIDLGRIDFIKAYRLQKQIVEELKSNGGLDTLIFCEHNPVFTLGRRAKIENILIDNQTLKEKGIQVFWIDRGGDITYHGPGQVVVYPILNLKRYKKDIYWYLRKLEAITIDLLAKFAIPASRKQDYTGVWVDSKKIASIGIGVSNWITYHGLALNVNTDLDYFSMIRPCNLDVKMTSMSRILSRDLDLSEVKGELIDCFQQNFVTSEKELCFKSV